eukprot:TRINITY_DN1231_c1_g1_i5.p3 TRINITY_DN1231_c1_g1~~TRINITY_DN1231_c1_g1_i5.p3  ORF type:complete len:162 (-),score=42.25 TRINITY_DN1231_c1_g1_i5:1698-2183(-)
MFRNFRQLWSNYRFNQKAVKRAIQEAEELEATLQRLHEVDAELTALYEQQIQERAEAVIADAAEMKDSIEQQQTKLKNLISTVDIHQLQQQVDQLMVEQEKASARHMKFSMTYASLTLEAEQRAKVQKRQELLMKELGIFPEEGEEVKEEEVKQDTEKNGP